MKNAAESTLQSLSQAGAAQQQATSLILREEQHRQEDQNSCLDYKPTYVGTTSVELQSTASLTVHQEKWSKEDKNKGWFWQQLQESFPKKTIKHQGARELQYCKEEDKAPPKRLQHLLQGKIC